MIIYAIQINDIIKLSLETIEGYQEVIVNMVTRKHDYGVPDNYEVNDGVISLMSIEDIEARNLESKLSSSTEQLCNSAYAYQKTGGIDGNFYGLLTTLIIAVPVQPKVQECITWLDGLWADYFTRKALNSVEPDLDFSSHGTVPYSYTEVRAEAEANQ